MNIKNLVCLVSVAVFATALTSNAQGLAEAAKKEKARRAKVQASGGAAKLYTDGDTSGTAASTSDASTAAAESGEAGSPSSPGAKKKEKTSEELAAEKQKEWADRVKKAQDEIKNLETVISRNERSLASTYNMTPARADLASSIEADKKKLADLKQSLVALEDERRRSGIARPR